MAEIAETTVTVETDDPDLIDFNNASVIVPTVHLPPDVASGENIDPEKIIEETLNEDYTRRIVKRNQGTIGNVTDGMIKAVTTVLSKFTRTGTFLYKTWLKMSLGYIKWELPITIKFLKFAANLYTIVVCFIFRINRKKSGNEKAADAKPGETKSDAAAVSAPPKTEVEAEQAAKSAAKSVSGMLLKSLASGDTEKSKDSLVMKMLGGLGKHVVSGGHPDDLRHARAMASAMHYGSF